MTDRSTASGLRLRVLLPIAVAMVALLATFTAILVVETGHRQAEDLARTAASVEVMATDQAAAAVEVMRSLMELTMRDEDLASALRARDRRTLLELSAPVLEQIRSKNRITHFYYILPDGTALLRVPHPERHGDKIDRFVLQEAQRTGKPYWGNEQGPLGSFTLRVVYPWRSHGELIGYLEMGIEFEDIMLSIKSFLDVDVFVAIDKTFFNQARWTETQAKKKVPVAWDEFPSVVVLSRTAPVIPPPIAMHLATRAKQHMRSTFETSWDEHVAQTVILPFANLRGQQLGELVVLRDITASASGRRRAIVGVALLGAVIGGVLMTFFYVLLGRVQRDVAARTARLTEAQRVLTVEQLERQRAERELGLQQERNELLEEQAQMARERLAAQKALEDRTNELAGSLSLLEATLESTADGILATQFSGGVSCSNERFRGLWGIPPEMLARGDGVELLDFMAPQTRDAEQFMARIQAVVAAPELESFDVIELQDGRIFERYCKPQRIDREVVGLVINFRDVTARRRAESELASIHAQLLDVSRQAGMAEIATNVLHNVGNALNSVNTSTNLLSDAIRSSKVPGLARAAAVLREHAHELGAFMDSDPRGKQLPAYLTQLAQHLAGEQEANIEELALLSESIDHINSIVAAQQQFATASSFKEDVDLGQLVADSLRMNQGAPSRDAVELVRECEELPRIRIEKHKVFQILVNLISNAKHACDDSGRSDKRVTVRVTRRGSRVYVAVIDNGVGIPPENLTRIFNYGFTTRQGGHGFGLHGGALAAKQLGGDLRVHSDGPGRGATFTLELPLEAAANQVAASTMMSTR